MGYLPIENYAVIGNLHTVALVGRNGSIDWFCFPAFDSPSVFAAILDEHKGGYFRITPAVCDNLVCKQMYWPETNVVVTRFLTPEGVAEIIDYMPVSVRREQDGFHGLIRQLKMVRGKMDFRMECRPAFDYGRAEHTVEIDPNGAKFHSRGLSLALASDRPLKQDGTGVVLEFCLDSEQSVSFELHELESGRQDQSIGIDDERCRLLFQQTVDYWQNWLSHCTYRGRWREMVYRSALVLKLLVFAPTGAIVAAPTTSLPEAPGGSRNWDYRFTWLRDAAFTVYSLIRIGFTEEAAHFMDWLEARCRELKEGSGLQVMYGIDGRHDLTEYELDHFEGYRGSRPVRIGNGAHDQLQLDIYGELMDSVYLYNKYGTPISYEMWTYLRRLMNWLCDNWNQKDEAIWEVRSGRQNFVYSRVMCWVALDRAIRLADKRSFPADRARWLSVRDEIYQQIQDRGWSENRQAFVQYYGSESLDASSLIMPLVFFMSPTDPRMISTIEAIKAPPSRSGLASDSLVYRYNMEETPDGLKGREGTFNMCTFWLVEALTRAGKVDRSRLTEARLIFERMLGYANHVGLYAEQTGPRGESLGNFPQAFTHLGLISAAFNLDRELGSRGA
jgi:GH15 family glucan-1,4-alpha-glucosidase